MSKSTYSSIFGPFGIAALERDAVTLVLETLRRNQTLDLWCLGVWLFAFTLWLNFTTDNELADLYSTTVLAFHSAHTLHRVSGQAMRGYTNVHHHPW